MINIGLNILIKIAVIMLLSLLVFGCSSNKKEKSLAAIASSKSEWTEVQKRKYFQDSIANLMYNGRLFGDTINGFEYFIDKHYPNIKSRNKYDAVLYACEEPWIDSTNIDTDKYWFRITVSPCFRKPYCLVIEKKLNKTYLTSKMLSGDGGYYSGLPTFSFTKFFDTTLYNQVSVQLNNLKFWKLDKDSTCMGGTDGEVWTFEAIENGKYNLISRWVPTHCGNETTLQLGRLGLMLEDSSRVFEVLKVAMDKPNNQPDNRAE